MPRQSDSPPHRHSESAPAPRRKSKVKFEVPVVEKAAEAPDVGWVYREPEAAAPVVGAPVLMNDEAVIKDVAAPAITTALTVVPWPEKEIPAARAAVRQVPDAARLAVMAGMGVLAFGVLTTGLASLAVVGLITGPVFAARRFFPFR